MQRYKGFKVVPQHHLLCDHCACSGGGGDVLWLAAGVALAGAWTIVFALAAAGVIDTA